jgi:hypothetical protein
MIKGKLYLDFDGILADWYKQICEQHGVPYVWKTPGPGSVDDNLGIPQSKYWDGVDVDFWASSPKTPDADAIIEMVLKYYKLEQISVMTLFPIKYDYPLEKITDHLRGKMLWLRKHYPDLAKQFTVTTVKHLSAGPQTVLLDDTGTNIEAFIDHGGYGILYPRIWNKKEHLRNTALEVLKHELDICEWAINNQMPRR